MPIGKQKRIFKKLISFTEEGKRACLGFFMGSAMKQANAGILATDNDHFRHEGDILLEKFSSRLFLVYRCISRFRQPGLQHENLR